MARILIAEDDSSMRSFLTMALERAGHQIIAAATGTEALSVLETRNDFDLLLSDIVMPGMDGIELSQKAAELYPELKIMFITGFAAVAMASTEPENDNAKILSKPFHLNDLVQNVEKILASV